MMNLKNVGLAVLAAASLTGCDDGVVGSALVKDVHSNAIYELIETRITATNTENVVGDTLDLEVVEGVDYGRTLVVQEGDMQAKSSIANNHRIGTTGIKLRGVVNRRRQ